ncbi:MAG: aldehyde dehydrogenase family protein, partial [Ilumatobacteraceae bacterium]
MRTELLIGGEWRQGSEDARIAVFDPATDETIAEVADGTPADAIAACDAAEAAQRRWAATAPRERSEILRSCWKILVDHTDELASLIVREHGKPMGDARGEIAYSAEFFRWNAEETVRIRGEIGVAPSGANRIIVHHPPVGVVVMVTPW